MLVGATAKESDEDQENEEGGSCEGHTDDGPRVAPEPVSVAGGAEGRRMS